MQNVGRPLWRRFALGAFASAAAIAMLIGTSVRAQEYPSRPIQVIVPFAGGSASDVVTRILLDRMGKSLGHPFIVDNRPGRRRQYRHAGGGPDNARRLHVGDEHGRPAGSEPNAVQVARL